MPEEAAINTAVTLIGTIGFPITMCLILIWMLIYFNKQHKEEMTNYTTALRDVKDAINTNTQTMLLLKEKIEREKS